MAGGGACATGVFEVGVALADDCTDALADGGMLNTCHCSTFGGCGSACSPPSRGMTTVTLCAWLPSVLVRTLLTLGEPRSMALWYSRPRADTSPSRSRSYQSPGGAWLWPPFCVVVNVYCGIMMSCACWSASANCPAL